MTAYLFLLMGIALLLIAALLFYLDQKQSKTWVRTTGTVIDISQSIGVSDKNQIPVIQFKDESNKEWRAKNSSSISGALYKIGDSIDLYYNPMKPTEILIDNIFHRYMGIFLFSLFGVICICTGLVEIIK